MLLYTVAAEARARRREVHSTATVRAPAIPRGDYALRAVCAARGGQRLRVARELGCRALKHVRPPHSRRRLSARAPRRDRSLLLRCPEHAGGV